MSYDPNSPLAGRGAAPATSIQAWFRERGHPPDDLGDSVKAEADAVGLNSDLVAAQVALETGFWTSDFARNRNNPAGLGAIDSAPGQALRFANPRAGIHAQVAHLLSYTMGASNPLKGDDPRFANVISAGFGGTAQALAGLAGRWASDRNYAVKIANLANNLLTFAGEHGGTGETPQEFITIVDATDWRGKNRPGLPMTVQFITVHETANTRRGADAASHVRYVQNGGGDEGVSFHYVVDDHAAFRIVPDDEVTWHAGDGVSGTGNRHSVAIEACVNSDGDWGRTRENLARLVAQLCREHNLSVRNVVQHNHWSGKDCPHRIRAENG